MNVIDFAREKQKRYTAEKETDPAALLPILQEWKETDIKKYSTLVAIICESAGITPTGLKKNGPADPAGNKIINLDKCALYRDTDPAALLPIFRQWKAQAPEKFYTMTAVICSSANMTAEDLLQEK